VSQSRKIWASITHSCANERRSSRVIRIPILDQVKPKWAEIGRLKREVTKLKAERDMLKKAVHQRARNCSG
jgi:hypothetical protein